ncbi:RNA-directed DNA polymerase [Paraburkholderia unamae]|uniref:RNA-directed DNA polymerase n=1 Tax=Paraburkholderia unamae TaxID=219649 RepID=UPI001CC5263B|nr:RNA-directed DNA polymerase [Paraburkholderia unamae]
MTSITNPIAQTFLSTHVVDYWGELMKHYRQTRLSASRPRFIRSGARGANIPSMQFLYSRKVIESAGYRFMLRTDISRFFPTIYTHSVPWALHGKAVAKRSRGMTPRFFGNLLDQSLRQAQDQQTFGLPIGPDTSHIIGEAIATAVDLELKKRLKAFPAGFRYVDDYFMFFATEREAEEALAALIRALKEYELQVNFEKTKTCKILEITEDFWSHRLRDFSIAKGGSRQASDFSHFFELAKELARVNSDESVMMYALKKASSVIVRKQNWDRFEAHVCQVAMGYPNTLQTVARLFSTYKAVGYKLGQIRLSRFVNALIEDHAPYGHHSEVAWCLWMAKDLNLTVSDANVDLISGMHSSVCALLLLDLQSMGRLAKAPKTTYWKTQEKPDALYDDMWLLSYEAGVRRWSGFGDKHITSNALFARLLALNVHFYDTNATLAPLFKVKANATLGAEYLENVDLFDLEDVEDYLDYDEEDGNYDNFVFSFGASQVPGVPENDEADDEGDDPDDIFSMYE